MTLLTNRYGMPWQDDTQDGDDAPGAYYKEPSMSSYRGWTIIPISGTLTAYHAIRFGKRMTAPSMFMLRRMIDLCLTEEQAGPGVQFV